MAKIYHEKISKQMIKSKNGKSHQMPDKVSQWGQAHLVPKQGSLLNEARQV